jgi:hypothetical protein
MRGIGRVSDSWQGWSALAMLSKVRFTGGPTAPLSLGLCEIFFLVTFKPDGVSRQALISASQCTLMTALSEMLLSFKIGAYVPMRPGYWQG